MTLSKRLLSKCQPKREIVTVPDVGDVEVRGLSLRESNRLVASFKKTESGDTEIDTAALLVACCFDPISGSPVFEESERERLDGSAVEPLLPLIHAAMKVNGLTAATVGNSETADANASASG